MYESLYLHLAKRLCELDIFEISNYNSFLLGSVYSRKNNFTIDCFIDSDSFEKGVILHNFVADYLKNNLLPFEYYHSLILDLDFIREDILKLYDFKLNNKEKTAFKNIEKVMSSPIPLMLVPEEIKNDYLKYLDSIIELCELLTT